MPSDPQHHIPESVQSVHLIAVCGTAMGALAAMRDRPDSTPDLPKLEVPVLVIHGADDQLIPRSEAEAMADALPDATLAIDQTRERAVRLLKDLIKDKEIGPRIVSDPMKRGSCCPRARTSRSVKTCPRSGSAHN